MKAKIAALHADKGCSDRLFQIFPKWFQEMKDFPRMPYPKPNISDDDFRTMASGWVKLNNKLR